MTDVMCYDAPPPTAYQKMRQLSFLPDPNSGGEIEDHNASERPGADPGQASEVRVRLAPVQVSVRGSEPTAGAATDGLG